MPLQTSLDFLNKNNDDASKGTITLLEALAIVNIMESALITARLHEIFEGDSKQLNHFLNTVHQDSI